MRLIDADALWNALQNEIDKAIPPYNDAVGAIRCGVRLARNILEDAPTIDAEPVRHGQWVGKKDHKWHCSECDGIAPKGYRYNYCPFCGAKMYE